MTLVETLLHRIIERQELRLDLIKEQQVYYKGEIGKLIGYHEQVASIQFQDGSTKKMSISYAEQQPTSITFFEGGKEQKYEAYKLFSGLPNKVVMAKRVTEFTISNEDNDLDRLLAKYTMNMKTKQDLKALTALLHQQFPLIQAPSWAEDDKVSLGKVLINKDYACRHIAGLAYSLLILAGKRPHFMRSNRGPEAHAFLNVAYNGIAYLADPVNNWIFPFENVWKRSIKWAKLPSFTTSARKSL